MNRPSCLAISHGQDRSRFLQFLREALVVAQRSGISTETVSRSLETAVSARDSWLPVWQNLALTACLPDCFHDVHLSLRLLKFQDMLSQIAQLTVASRTDKP